jgi:hypothetical protein
LHQYSFIQLVSNLVESDYPNLRIWNLYGTWDMNPSSPLHSTSTIQQLPFLQSSVPTEMKAVIYSIIKISKQIL